MKQNGQKKVDASKPWEVIEAVLPTSSRVLLYGPPGTGKTTAAMRSADGQPVFSITLTEETPAAELRGHYVPHGDRFVWHHGPAMRAWEEGGLLILNEIDQASGDALTFLLGVLDDPEVAGITLPTNATVRPNARFRAVGTMNGVPTDLPEPLRDRFAVNVEVDEPHPEAINALPEDLRQAARVAAGIDDAARRISVRAWFAFAELREAVGAEVAAAAVFGVRARTVLDTLRTKAYHRV